MYKGKSIKQLNDKLHKKNLEKMKNNSLDLNNLPNPYDLIRQAQKEAKNKNKNSRMPYQWVKNSTPFQQTGQRQDLTNNISNTISRVQSNQSFQNNEFFSNNQFSNNFPPKYQNKRQNQKNQQYKNSLEYDMSDQRQKQSSNNNFTSTHKSVNSSISYNKQFIESLFEDQEESNKDQYQFKYHEPEYPYQKQHKPYKQIQIDRPFRVQPQALQQKKPKDIFRTNNQNNNQRQRIENTKQLTGLIQCNKDKKLTTIRILDSNGPVIKNYQTGDIKYWQQNSSYPDFMLRQALRKFPHVKEFKNNQKAIIKCALNQNDVFTCIPTGGGKSLIFQIMTFIKKGIYLCILPLISLIYDQQTQANNFKIQAYSLTGATHINKVKEVYAKIDTYTPQQESILIFCTPEKISLSQQFMEILAKVYRNGYLRHVIIDQVHCVSTWGKQFRKQYENLSQVKVFFPKTPILALTATVTQTIKQQIIKKLKLTKCQFFQSSFNRPNLMYEVRKKSKKSAFDQISNILEDHRGQSGIIYCLSRRQCQQMCKNLNGRRYSTAFYHAELHDKQKRVIQSQWMDNKIKIIIATIAFGMGINKPDVRFVIHNSLSKSLENYYQQSGRAGRDGLPAKCILFYQRNDRTALQAMNLKNQYSSAVNKQFSNKQLSHMVKYCEEIYLCRRQFQLNYLGQTDFDSNLCNKTCDNCIKGRKFKQYQCIAHAKEIANFMLYVSKDRITRAQAISALKGKNQKLKNHRVESYPNIDRARQLFRYWTADQMEQIFLQLITEQILKQNVIVTKVPKIGNVSNVYLECTPAKLNKFIQKVQTLPLRRQFKEDGKKSSTTIITRQNIFAELFGDEDQQIIQGDILQQFGTSDSYDNIDFSAYTFDNDFERRQEQIKRQKGQFTQIEYKKEAINNDAQQKINDQKLAKTKDFLKDLFDEQEEDQI